VNHALFLNKSFSGHYEIFILGFYISKFEVGSERYEFSKVDHQTVIWRKKEIVTFENIIRNFYIIMHITRKLQGLVSSTSLISVWKLIWVELNEHEKEI